MRNSMQKILFRLKWMAMSERGRYCLPLGTNKREFVNAQIKTEYRQNQALRV